MSFWGGSNHGLDAAANGNVACKKGLLVFRTYFLVKDGDHVPGEVAFYGEKKCKDSHYIC